MPADPTAATVRTGPAGRQVRLAELTTIGLGGPAPSIDTARSAAEVAEMVGAADRSGGVLVLGGGSNLVVADAGVRVPVVRIAVPGLSIEKTEYDGDPADSDPAMVARAVGVRGAGGSAAIATVGAGEDWDAVVASLVADGWAGVETLSGIPGSAGATPVQNVGAYGTEIADVLVDVELYDRAAGTLRRVPAADLRMGYRDSALRGTDRAVVTAVRLRLRRTPAPVRYPELARVLGVAPGEVAPAAEVRAAVLDLRRGKGMVLDAADPDTRSAGSFFTNPIVGPAALRDVLGAVRGRLGPDVAVPQYPAGPTAGLAPPAATKLSAAWLIERAGFPKGYPLVAGGAPGPAGAVPDLAPPSRAARPAARITVSTKHTLALTNRGGGTATELVALAREIRDGVRDAFGVSLRPEPVLVGVSLD